MEEKKWTQEQLEQMKNLDIHKIDKSELVDLKDVIIDENLPKEKRILSYLEQIKNPYFFKIGDTVIQLQFSENQRSLEDCLKSYFSLL